MPYTNHYGHGDSMGYCDLNNNGRAFISYDIIDKYNGNSIISLNGNKLYMVNDFLLDIKNIHGPWANAEIIKNDFTTQSCYIGKINDKFVIASSIKEAIDELRELIKETYNNEKDLAKAFVIAHPNYNKEYDWDEMVLWHSITKNSCANGRKEFSFKAHKKPGSTATPKELITIMKNYGVIRLSTYMEQFYAESKY